MSASGDGRAVSRVASLTLAPAREAPIVEYRQVRKGQPTPVEVLR